MPSPARLARSVSYDFNNIVLSPPSSTVQPRISAAGAWQAVLRLPGIDHRLQLQAMYQLILADWNSTNPSVPSPRSGPRMLVWLVIARHLWISTLTNSNYVHPPRCIYESAMWPVNATSRLVYGQMAFPPRAETFH